MTEPPRPEVSKASPTLFRNIARIARQHPRRFDMSAWHQCNGHVLDLKYLDRDKFPLLYDCGTAHCLAGWIVVSTPGGVELEHWLTQRWQQWKGEPWSVIHADCGLAGHWRKDYDSFVSATALTALVILEKAGWHEAQVSAPPFDSGQFYVMTETGLRYLNELEKEEAIRFPGIGLVA